VCVCVCVCVYGSLCKVVVAVVGVVVVVVVVVVVKFYTNRAKIFDKNLQNTNLRPNLTYHIKVLNCISTDICLHSAR